MQRLINLLKEKYHLIFILLLSLTPITWLWGRGGILINGSDTNFPLDPVSWFLRRLYVWNPSLNAGTEFSFSTAGTFFHFLQVVPTLLGVGLQGTQIINLVFWFSLVIVFSYLLATRLFPEKVAPRLVFVVLYAFNIYLFNTWENVKVSNLALVSTIPFGIYILLSLRKKLITYSSAGLLSAILGIVAMGGGINPAYFSTLFFVLFIFYLTTIFIPLDFKEVKDRTKEFAFVSLIVILVNLHWILPTISFIVTTIGPTGSIDKIGYTNWVDSLSQNTSLLNILRVQGAWDWYAFDSSTNLPLYIPYALNYFFRFPFIAFSFFITFLSLISLIARKGKDNLGNYVFFASLLVIGAFLGAGTHFPTGILFRQILINKLPFFSLFRSPWYIFTPLVTIAYAGLVAYLVDRIKPRFLNILFALILIVGNLTYTYPLVTGKIFRPKLPDNFLIRFPQYVFDAQKWLNSKENYERGRIISFPDDEIERFKWGYNGIDSIVGLISPSEVLFNPLNTPEAPVSQLLREVYDSLRKGEIENAENVASVLGSAWLFQKNDQSSLSLELPDGFSNFPVTSFDKWNFFEFPTPKKVIPRVRAVANMYLGFPSTEGAKLAGVLPSESILINPKDSIVELLPKEVDLYGNVILAQNSQLETFTKLRNSSYKLSDHLGSRDLSVVDYDFFIPVDGSYKLMLERYAIEKFGINPALPLDVLIDGQKYSLATEKVTDSYVYMTSPAIAKGSHSLRLTLNNPNLIDGGDFEGATNYTQKGDAEFTIIQDGGNRFISIFNRSQKDTSAIFKLKAFDPMAIYHIEVKYKQIYGSMASILGSQFRTQGPLKSQILGMPNYPEWGTFSFYYEPIKTKSDLDIALNAERINDALGTKVYYDDLSARPIFTNKLILVKENAKDISTPMVTFTRVNPTEYVGEVTGASGPHVLLFSDNYSMGWALEINGTNVNQDQHFSGNLYANAWFIDKSPESYKFKLRYKPQSMKVVGGAISILALLSTLGVFVYVQIKGRRV